MGKFLLKRLFSAEQAFKMPQPYRGPLLAATLCSHRVHTLLGQLNTIYRVSTLTVCGIKLREASLWCLQQTKLAGLNLLIEEQ